MSAGVARDLTRLLASLRRGHGRARIVQPLRRLSSPWHKGVTDACSSPTAAGLGGLWPPSGRAWACDVPEAARTLHINVLEAVAALVQLLLNRDCLHGAVIEEHIDNDTVVCVFRSLKSKSPRLHLVGLWRDDVLRQLNARASAHWIAGSDNTIADSLSRGDLPTYRAAAAAAGFAGDSAPRLVSNRELHNAVDFAAMWDTLLRLPF